MTKYYDEEHNQALRSAFEKYVLTWPYVTIRLMFGCPAYLVNGKLFAFLVNDGVVIAQILKLDREEIQETFETHVFQAGEREISRWFQVTIEDLKKLPKLIRFVKKSYTNVLGDTDTHQIVDVH